MRSHRLANSAVELAGARVAVWQAAWLEDEHRRAGHRAAAAAAASVTAASACAHEAVQMFGAAGTADPVIVGLFRAAYEMAGVCGSPRQLWQSAGARWAADRIDSAPTE